MGFGAADRTAAPAYRLLLDRPRARAWRLTLAPGEAAPAITQSGPGVRVVLGGQRLIDTRPGQIGREAVLVAGDATFLPPSTRVTVNAGETPLDVVEIELR